MKYNGIIFDFNGTLLNDVDLCLELLNKLLEMQGKSVILKEKYLENFGFPIKDYYIKCGIDFSLNNFSELADMFHVFYNDKSIYCKLFPDVIGALEELKKMGYKLYVLSASKLETLKNQLEFYKIAHYFDEILGLDNNHASSKEYLAEDFRRRHSLEKYIYIGDTDHDYHIGCIIDAKILLFNKGHQSEEKLLNLTTDVISNIKEIKNYL